jgi:hypothetical protein
MADEIWDGRSSLIFIAGGEQLVAIPDLCLKLFIVAKK